MDFTSAIDKFIPGEISRPVVKGHVQHLEWHGPHAGTLFQQKMIHFQLHPTYDPLPQVAKVVRVRRSSRMHMPDPCRRMHIQVGMGL